ncbi:hypothetical protein ACF059_25975 [Streptomyces sp. NPDC016562]|uniref:hypothetical protein n=1 Tax=Streptomyces sp. NPDC016562 TaxID=3364966 RepID=UPI0036F804AE
MAKNKNQKQPAKQQTRSSQDPSKGSMDTPSQSVHPSPSPMDLAHKSKQKKFGHN